MELTKSADEAERAGVLHARISLEPSTVETGFGPLQIAEAWLEGRPHPQVLKRARELGGLQPDALSKEHLLLCLRHRPLDIEEVASGGIWFTAAKEWRGFKGGDAQVRQFRLWDGEPCTIELTVAQLDELELDPKGVKPMPGKGRLQTLRIVRSA